MNKVWLSGRLGQDSKTGENNGSSWTKINIATTERWKTKDGEKKEKTEWHTVFLRYKIDLVKGALVNIEGSISYKKKEDGK